MRHIAIVEDEKECSRQIEEYLARYARETGEKFEHRTYDDGKHIVRDYPEDLDIIFMDIQMAEMDGMSTAEEIRKKDSSVVIIFITGLASYAVRGYAVDAMGYLVKPVSYAVFSQCLDRVLSKLQKRKTRNILVNGRNETIKVNSGDILYVEVEDHSLIYHTLQGDIRASGAIRDAEESLSGISFFRCNKGYLVNLAYVDQIIEDDAVIRGERLQVSRSKKKAFLDALNRYINEAE